MHSRLDKGEKILENAIDFILDFMRDKEGKLGKEYKVLLFCFLALHEFSAVNAC